MARIKRIFLIFLDFIFNACCRFFSVHGEWSILSTIVSFFSLKDYVRDGVFLLIVKGVFF